MPPDVAQIITALASIGALATAIVALLKARPEARHLDAQTDLATAEANRTRALTDAELSARLTATSNELLDQMQELIAQERTERTAEREAARKHANDMMGHVVILERELEKVQRDRDKLNATIEEMLVVQREQAAEIESLKAQVKRRDEIIASLQRQYEDLCGWVREELGYDPVTRKRRKTGPLAGSGIGG